VDAEQTDVFVDRQKQPDLVISHAGGLTVILETEFSPAHGVEADTRRRLGQTVKATSEQIEQCIAVKMPVSLRKIEQKHLEMAIKTARYNYVVFTFDGKDELYDHIELSQCCDLPYAISPASRKDKVIESYQERTWNDHPVGCDRSVACDSKNQLLANIQIGI